MTYNLDIDYVNALYDIRDDGTVRNLSNMHVVPGSVRNGYRYVRISSLRVSVPVHLLVCLRYHGAAPSVDSVVRHLDGNKANNKAVNLAWSTFSEIVCATYEAGRRPYWKNKRRDALSDVTKEKMSKRKCKPVVCDDEEYSSVSELIAAIGISRKTFNNNIGSGVIKGHKVHFAERLDSLDIMVRRDVVTPHVVDTAYSLDEIEKDYTIFDDGRVFSKRRNEFLKPIDTGLSVVYNLRVKWYTTQVSAARLVAMKYLPAIPGKREVSLKDGNMYNTRIDNLVWMSRREVRLKGNESKYWWKDNFKIE